ncbi:hypothetical protein KSS87_018698, partial [Heliosperma pusillum]
MYKTLMSRDDNLHPKITLVCYLTCGPLQAKSSKTLYSRLCLSRWTKK